MSYASPADLIARKSVQTLGDLVSDDGTRITPTGLLANVNLQDALNDASGEIEAALLQGNRYQVSDLNALSGNSQGYLKRITCEIAWAFLLSRKPDRRVEELKAALELQDVYLERLRTGKNVFNVAAEIAAGQIAVVVPSVQSVQTKNLIRDMSRNYYPTRVQSG